jgi:hypothetical protein
MAGNDAYEDQAAACILNQLDRVQGHRRRH